MNPALSITSRVAGALAGAAFGRLVQVAVMLALPHEHQWLSGGEVAKYGLPLIGALYGVLVGPMLLDRPAGARHRLAQGASATLIALGGACLGLTLGAALHAAAGALLAPRNLDYLLDSRATAQGFAGVAGLLGLAVALLLVARWRRADPDTSRGVGTKLVALTAVAAIGGGWAGHYLGYASGIVVLSELLGITGDDYKGSVILLTIAGTLLLFAGAIWLTLHAQRPDWGSKLRIGHAALALPLALVLASSSLALNRRLDDTSTGDLPTIFFEIRLPAGAAAPARDDVKIELMTEQGTEPAELYKSEWLMPDGDRLLLKGFFDTKIAHPAQRVVALALPGQPKRLFDLRLPRNPKSTRVNGAWQRVDFADEIGRAADAGDGTEIRFHAWRP